MDRTTLVEPLAVAAGTTHPSSHGAASVIGCGGWSRLKRRGRQIGGKLSGTYLRRYLAAGTISLLAVTVASACGSASADDKAALVQQDSRKSLVQCGMNAVDGALAQTPNALKKASQVYQETDSTGNVVAALESVYGGKLSDFTYDEQSEGLFILSGLDYCDEDNAAAQESASKAVTLLLSAYSKQP